MSFLLPETEWGASCRSSSLGKAKRRREGDGRGERSANKYVGRSYVEFVVWGSGQMPAVNFDRRDKRREDGKTMRQNFQYLGKNGQKKLGLE